MGGGGTKTVTSGGSQNTVTEQKAVIPEELKPLYSSTAQAGTRAQAALPLTGTVGYTGQMANPAYDAWAKQWGSYNMPSGGKYYTSGGPAAGLPDYETWRRQQTGQQGTLPLTKPADWEVFDPTTGMNRYGLSPGTEGSFINVPGAPSKYINDPATRYQKTPDFTAAQIQGIAPLSDIERQAMDLSTNLNTMPLNEIMAMLYGTMAPEVAAQTPTNAGMYSDVESSPYFTAAKKAFDVGIQPAIENQMALSGLGASSSLGNALSMGWASQVPNILSQYATQYVEPELGRQERGVERQSGALQQMAPVFSAMGQMDTSRAQQAVQSMLQTGGLERSVEQASLDAVYQDMLRRQALAEEALYTPMGMLIPSAIGQSSATKGTSTQTQTAPSSGGGLFK